MTSTTDAGPDAPPTLEALDPIQAEIDATETRIKELYLARADVFLAIQEADPTVKVKAMADRVGVTGPAVSQQIDKAKARRHDREVAARAAAAADPGSEPA